MNFFQTIGTGFSKAFEFVADRNHKAAVVNRLRIVIKNERENASRAYVALGKYYMENLRDPENELTERLCRSAQDSERRIRKAFAKLDELSSESAPEEASSCDSCKAEDGGGCCSSITPSEFFTGTRRAYVLPDWSGDEKAVV